MRTSFSRILSRVDRLAERVRVVAADKEAEFLASIKTMTDSQLEFHLVQTTEQLIGQLADFETLDALVEKHRVVTAEEDTVRIRRVMREPYTRRRWFIEHAAHGQPELVSPTQIGDPSISKDLPLGPRLLVACPCQTSEPWGSGRIYTYWELVPNAFRRRLLERHA